MELSIDITSNIDQYLPSFLPTVSIHFLALFSKLKKKAVCGDGAHPISMTNISDESVCIFS